MQQSTAQLPNERLCCHKPAPCSVAEDLEKLVSSSTTSPTRGLQIFRFMVQLVPGRLCQPSFDYLLAKKSLGLVTMYHWKSTWLLMWGWSPQTHFLTISPQSLCFFFVPIYVIHDHGFGSEAHVLQGCWSLSYPHVQHCLRSSSVPYDTGRQDKGTSTQFNCLNLVPGD